MQISVRADVKKAVAQLNRIQRKQIPFATARALSQTAEFTAVNLNQATREYFDKPTPFTQRAFTYTRATKTRLVAVVMARPRQDSYLQFQVYGGRRTPTGRALVLPVTIPLDRYGNIPRRAVRKQAAKPNTFSANINGVVGLWQRTRAGLRLLVAYERSATYQKRFPLQALSDRFVRRGFPVFFERSLRNALATAR